MFKREAKLMFWLCMGPIVIGLIVGILVPRMFPRTHKNSHANSLSAIDSVVIRGASPAEGEIKDIEERLANYIRNNPPADREPIRDILGYKIQYMTFQAEDGRRLIYINAVCRAFSPKVKDWGKEIVVVMDGGSCFFNLKYDPESRKFFDFWINGEA